MAIFKTFPKGSVIGSGDYVFRHYGEEGRLPREYQEVEWIKSDENSYISLGFFDPDKKIIEWEQIIETDTAGNGWGMTASISASSPRLFTTNSSATLTFWLGSNGSGLFGSVSNLPNNKKLKCVVRANLSEVGSYGKVYDGDNLLGQFTATDTESAHPQFINGDFYIFSARYSNTRRYGIVKIGTFKVTDLSGENKYFLIPCYRKTDGTIGMYDIISEQFFTNAGTGSFTKGADVK